MAGVCTSCGMTGGGVEFFTEQQTIPNILANDKIACQKDYGGCVYSAQGAILCNLKQVGGEVPKKKVMETFVPGPVIGGLPNWPELPNKKELVNDNAPEKLFY